MLLAIRIRGTRIIVGIRIRGTRIIVGIRINPSQDNGRKDARWSVLYYCGSSQKQIIIIIIRTVF